MLRVFFALVVPFTFLLSACGQKQETLRYRLTVEVETPEGVKAGSSVVEVRVRETGEDSWAPVEARGVRADLRGEAVAIDLPGGRTLFALLRTKNRVDAAKWWPFSVVSTEPFDGEYAGIRRAQQMKREMASGILPIEDGPMFVTFQAINDPTSVQSVDPTDLASSLGSGVNLKQIMIEITDEEVTDGIEQRLVWLDTYKDRWFNGDELVFEDMRSAEISAHLYSGSFSTEYAK